jgi:hypothetical protein
MGFDPFDNVGVLVFEGTRYKGAEVKVRLDLPGSEELGLYEAQALDDEVSWLAEHAIIEWNLQSGGQPLPVTPENAKALSRPFKRALVMGYLKAVTDIDAPLSPSSSGGEPSGTE